MIGRKLLLLFAFTASFATATFNDSTTSAFSNVFPDTADTSGGADVVLINANTRYVRKTNGTVRVWFPNNNGSVEIRYGNFCSGVRGDYVEGEDGSFGQWANGAPITRFVATGAQGSDTYYGRKGQNCSATHTFSFTGITTQQNGYFYRDIDIDYVGGHTNPFSGAVNGFVVVAPGQPNARVGIREDPNDTGHMSTQDQLNSSPTYTQYNVPFGTPCGQTGTSSAQIFMYDLDNAGGGGAQVGRDVTVRLFDRTTNNYVDFTGSSHSGNPGSTWRPANLQNDDQWVRFTSQENHKYRLEIRDVYLNNTIQYSVPYSQIFSEPCSGAQIIPKATVNGSTSNITEPLGTQLTFRNWAHTKNLYGVGSDTFQLRVAVTDGTIPGGGWGPQDLKIAPEGDSPDDKTKVVFTPTAAGRYCRETRIRNMPSYASTPNGIDNQVCATITAPPAPTHRVIIRPVAQDGPDIEPTEMATNSGSVEVTNFPPVTSWGYDDYSERLPAERVTPTVTNDGVTRDSRIVYSCPSGYSPSGTSTTPPTCSKTVPGATTYYCPHGVDTTQANNCKHFYNGTGNDTKGECEGNGHVWSSGSCYDTHAKSSTTAPPTTQYTAPDSSTQYRYRCEDPNAEAWGSWGGSRPTNCKKQYTCPGGAEVRGTSSTSDWRTSEPLCDGWQCAYASPQVNQSSAPTCEFRCNGGRGNLAPNGSPTRATPCYQPPRFTLTCRWDDGSVVTSTVRADGAYCVSSVQERAGVNAIGTEVCATITPSTPAYPGAWSPNPPLPGWGNGGTNPNAPYSQRQRWAWNVTPPAAEACSKVVAKPVFKVLGGDIFSGAAFASGSICNPVNTGAIASWPHEATFGASGTELGAFAAGAITGFPSAQIRAANAQPPRALTFANNVGGGQQYGGGYGASSCAFDHYGDPSSFPSIGNISSIGSAAQDGVYRATGGAINGNRTIQTSRQVIVHVDGDVYIRNNIIYGNRGSWPDIASIPGLKMVVSGNIYIDPGVTQLDGVYVAQPRPTSPATSGNIYTCATATAGIATTNLFAQCRTNKLIVNGAFIAKKVHLLRTSGTAIFDQSAEDFNYLPEVWLTPWPITNTVNQLKYDSIIGLPPVL